MIGTVLLTLGAFGLAGLGLGLGVLAGRAPLKGSCGGLSCGACKGSCARRREDPK